jgi:hypothetical protein
MRHASGKKPVSRLSNRLSGSVGKIPSHIDDHLRRTGGLAAFFHEMGKVDRLVVLGFLEMMWRQSDGQNRHTSIKPGAHQSVDHGCRNEIVPVDAAINDQRRGSNRCVSSGRREIARDKRKLEGAGDIEYIDLSGWNEFQKTVERFADDIGMPVCLDECEASGCHLISLGYDTSPKAITHE